MRPRQPVMDPRQRQADQIGQKYENRGHLQDIIGDKLRKKAKTLTRILMNNPNGLTGAGREEKINRLKNK